MTTTQTRYGIQIIDSPNQKIPCFAALSNQWDGGWRTQEVFEAKTWKTVRGTQRWMDARPAVKGKVVVLEVDSFGRAERMSPSVAAPPIASLSISMESMDRIQEHTEGLLRTGSQRGRAPSTARS